MLRAGLLFVLLTLLGLPHGTDAPSAAHDLEWWTTHALAKIRPDDAPPATRAEAVSLSAARNEFEPFQLVLRAGRAPLEAVDVEMTELVGERTGARIAQRWTTIYLQRYLKLERASSIEEEAGRWPDPLIPRIDAYHGERRSAFPFRLAAGSNQPLWIEIYVPQNAPPDHYRGTVEVSVDGAPLFSVPVALEVWSFSLPSTSSLRTSFGYSGPGALVQHRGAYTSDQDLFALTRLYATAALRHRLSLHGGSMKPPPTRFEGTRAVVDWTEYDREHAPLLDGTLFGPDDYLPGAQATSIDVVTAPELTPPQKVVYWREWAAHFRERGWLDRLFLYLMDEPRLPDDLEELRRRGRLVRAADPELRTLLTEQLVPELAELIDIWTPLINCIEVRDNGEPYCEETVPRDRYASVERRHGAEVWWYQSCASHGCSERGEEPYTGWPSYAIDAPATAHRVMPWLAWRMGVEGELYYNTVESYLAEGADPWRDVSLHGGNGDGSLFYPGTPERIGGTSHVPVESIRLKLIREGLEDYEYLKLAADRGIGELAASQARRVAAGTYRWRRDPDSMTTAREALGRALDGTDDRAGKVGRTE